MSSSPVVCCHHTTEVLCLFEDEVVLLQDSLLLQDEGDDEEGNEGRGLSRGLPGITYQLADFQVCHWDCVVCHVGHACSRCVLIIT